MQVDRSFGRALWFTAPGECEIRAGEVAPGGVTVDAICSGISRGTEALVLAGRVPPSEAQRMRGPHQEGAFPFPVKYGYAMVGVARDGRLAGRQVFCLHPHQDRFRLPEEALHPLPEGLPPERAVLAANMETALNIVWDAQATVGDRVNVFGAGVVGLLAAHLLARMGAEVSLVDPAEARRGIAAALGLKLGAPLPDADIAINTSGTDAALADAIGSLDFEGRLVEASWHGEGLSRLPLGGTFHSRRLSIVSSQVGQVPPARRARWPHARRLAKALDLLDPHLDALVACETPFDRIAEDFPKIVADPATLCHLIRY